MATYRTITLPAVDALRSYVLSALARGNATVYQRADGSHVESRETWPSPPAGPDPATLTETPADPVATLGWILLTPAPS